MRRISWVWSVVLLFVLLSGYGIVVNQKQQTAHAASSGTSQLALRLLELINSDRAAYGLYPYTLNSTLSAGALRHSMAMANGCGMSHQCFGESDPCTRMANEGVSWTICGENIGYSGPDPTDWAGVRRIEQGMLNEQPPDDGHRQNLLSSSYRYIGVGVIIDSNGIIWITEDLTN